MRTQKELQAMTIEELEAEIQDIGLKIDQLKTDRKMVARALEEKLNDQELRKKLETLTPADKLKMAQLLSAEGIETVSKVGIPGN